MAEIQLVRQNPVEISEADREAVRRVLFGIIDGLGERGRRQWRRFINRLLRLAPGEMINIWTHQDRVGWYHRKHMVMEQRLFESQERFDQFNAFRDWLKVGSGFVDWYPGPKGAVMPVPRSLSFEKLEQGEMEQVHADMLVFLRTEHAIKTLWPKLPAAQRHDAIEAVLSQFGSFAQ